MQISKEYLEPCLRYLAVSRKALLKWKDSEDSHKNEA